MAALRTATTHAPNAITVVPRHGDAYTATTPRGGWTLDAVLDVVAEVANIAPDVVAVRRDKAAWSAFMDLNAALRAATGASLHTTLLKEYLRTRPRDANGR